MKTLVYLMLPEIILCVVAGVLFLLGISNRASSRKLAPVLALGALVLAAAWQWTHMHGDMLPDVRYNTIHVFLFTRFVKFLAACIGILLLLLAWPGNRDGTGSSALHFGTEASEFYALMLLSIAGIFLVAEANDIMLLFLGIELASIPTYIMVSISRPLPVAQEAGVKYFFLGALAAAVMLFGFSYLYGVTGTTQLDQMANAYTNSPMATWKLLAVVLLICGFAFKMAAVPMHVYAGDVYQGAATPVTAFLSFVPKISGFVALLKILYAVSGGMWTASPQIVKLLWVLSVLTMSVGNILGLVQGDNIKRVFAYSSIAHTGYMLAGVTALVHTRDPMVQESALRGVMFYLAAYGLMNIGAFGVLILLPSRRDLPATSAETFDDLAGLGQHHLLLALAMAVSCFSLIGLPLTVGFFGKYYLIAPAFQSGLRWLPIILVLNAAVSAAYYLRIVSALFLRPEPSAGRGAPVSRPVHHPLPVLVSVGISMVGILWLGIILPATNRLTGLTQEATHMEQGVYPGR